MPALEGQFLKEISVRFAGENHLRTQKSTKQSSAQRFLNDPFPFSAAEVIPKHFRFGNSSTHITEHNFQNNSIRDSVILCSHFLPGPSNFRNNFLSVITEQELPMVFLSRRDILGFQEGGFPIVERAAFSFSRGHLLLLGNSYLKSTLRLLLRRRV